MTEREIADHLFDVARARARESGRYFGEGAGHDLLDLTSTAAGALAQLPDRAEQARAIAAAQSDLQRLIDDAIADAATIPDYPPDLLGERTYFPARFRFCPCPPFCH